MWTSTLFLLQKPTSNFSKFIVCPHLTWTGAIELVLTFFWTRGGQFFMILSRCPWMPSEQKKTAKLSLGYRPTNSNSYTIVFTYY